ncbi:hypothetical protein FRC12_001993 [Ceratobasidium sp. 428]|nr:hypothetical protein FRC12_001993 [Ceratobasidium sp. 428]
MLMSVVANSERDSSAIEQQQKEIETEIKSTVQLSEQGANTLASSSQPQPPAPQSLLPQPNVPGSSLAIPSSANVPSITLSRGPQNLLDTSFDSGPGNRKRTGKQAQGRSKG